MDEFLPTLGPLDPRLFMDDLGKERAAAASRGEHVPNKGVGVGQHRPCVGRTAFQPRLVKLFGGALKLGRHRFRAWARMRFLYLENSSVTRAHTQRTGRNSRHARQSVEHAYTHFGPLCLCWGGGGKQQRFSKKKRKRQPLTCCAGDPGAPEAFRSPRRSGRRGARGTQRRRTSSLPCRCSRPRPRRCSAGCCPCGGTFSRRQIHMFGEDKTDKTFPDDSSNSSATCVRWKLLLSTLCSGRQDR